jgi:RNA polymerase sigma factor (sigma-70 family)
MSPEPHEPTDEILLGRALKDRAGAEGRDAATALFARYRGRVYLWCFGYVRDHERALDLAQDALLLAWRSLDSFAGRARFSSWLFAIARNRCLSAMRPVSLLRDASAQLDDLIDPQPGPEERLEAQEDEDRLIALFVQTLEPQEQEAMFLRCVERLPVDEITRTLGVTAASGARGVLQTARRKLAAALARREDVEGRGA